MSGEYGMRRVPLTRVVASRWQARNAVFDEERLWELACSIREQGLINAIVVFPVRLAEDDPDPWYELVAGERRTRAILGLAWAKMDKEVSEKAAVERLAREGLTAVPVKVRELLEAARSEIEARVELGEDLGRLHRIAVVENLERESLSALEEARALEGLQEEYGWSQRELARRIGKSQSYVAQRLSLLGLTAVAEEALSTRALNATHARAIARVPNELQPVVTRWATAAVGRDDSPATTRQVQNAARQVAKFVDPERWEPNGEKVYRPMERNYLALMKWAVIEADLKSCGKGLLALRADGYNKTNWLAKKPLALVQLPYGLGEVLRVLGRRGGVGGTWEEFAGKMEWRCARCVFFPYCRPGMVETIDGLHGHCERWNEPETKTCVGFIGAGDPVVIPLRHELRGWFEKLRIEVEEEPFAYVTDVGVYVGGYNQAAAAKRDQREAAAKQKAREHVERIQVFVDWQAEWPVEWMEHFQAHACVKCVNYRPELEEEGMAPCRFCVEALGTSWSKEQFAAPDFGVLVTQDGRMLPRCAQFTYRETPVLARVEGMRFGERRRAVEWLHGMVVMKNSYSNSVLWGVLRWLDYGRPVDNKTQDMDRLQRWILREWDALGGSEAVATLLDVALSEARVRGSYRDGVIRLVNGVTGEVEEWAGVDFRYVTGEYDRQYGRNWPEGWGQPWEKEQDSRN